MKLFIVFAAFVAVAVGGSFHKPASFDDHELAAIVAAIHSPSTDPATAELLLDMLEQLMQSQYEPPSVGPVIVDDLPPIGGPAIIDDLPPTQEPVVIGPIPNGATPLVQIIVNVAGGAPIAPGAVADAPAGDEVIVVDSPVEEPSSPVEVVDLPVSDVVVVDLPAPPPVGVEVGDLPALPISPVQIGVPQLPVVPAVLPDDLN